jgi:hypothetical protein
MIIITGFIGHPGMKGEEVIGCGVNYFSSCIGREPDYYRGFLWGLYTLYSNTKRGLSGV